VDCSGDKVSIDGTVLDPSTPFTVSAGEEHVVAVAAEDATPFRGYLLVLSTVNEGIDLSAALVASDAPVVAATGAPAAAAASDVPSVIPTVDDEPSPPSPLSSGGGEYQYHGAQLRRHHRQQLQYHHG
jgi:hypothetical protein